MLSNHEELGCRGLCLFFLHRHHRQSHFLSVNGDNLHPHWSFFRIPLLLYFSWIKLTLNSDDKEKTRHQIFGRSNECQCNFSWELSALLIKDQLMCWLFDGFSSSPQSRSIPLVFWKRNFNEKNVRSSSCESYKHTILIAWFLSQKLIKSKSLISWQFMFKIFRQIGFEITWMQCKFFCLSFWTKNWGLE